MSISTADVIHKLENLRSVGTMKKYQHRENTGTVALVKDLGKTCINGRFHFFVDIMKPCYDEDSDDDDVQWWVPMQTSGKNGCEACKNETKRNVVDTAEDIRMVSLES